MKVLVTGGCGFIGSHLVDALLAAGHEVALVDDRSRGRHRWLGTPAPRVFEQSILEPDALTAIVREVAPTAVYHLAADHYIPVCEADPGGAFRLNVGGTLEVVEACRAAGTVERFFFASTADVYGRMPYPHVEAEPANPSTVYGETKLVGEQILRRYRAGGHVDFAIMIGRIFNAAGTRETNPHFLPAMVEQVMAGKRTVEVGNLWPLRDFTDVVSMAQAIRALTEGVEGVDVVNVGSGAPVEVGEALAMLFEAGPDALDFVSVPEKQRPNDRPFLAPDVSALRRRLGWTCAPFGPETARALWDEAQAART